MAVLALDVFLLLNRYQSFTIIVLTPSIFKKVF